MNAAIITELEAVHAARETALKWARELIRQCATSIRATHRHEWAVASQLLAEAGQMAQNLRDRLADHPAILHAGYTQDALKEYAEAHLTYALVHGDELPGHGAIGVEPAAYLNGLAEAASELRRYILDGLRSGNVAEGERLLTQMDDIYSFLVTVDFPDAVTGGLRRTTDALRAVLERTRGDLTSAVRQDQLIAALARFEAQTGSTARPAMETPDATND
ncbi:MAG TPA: haloacid dehalogenase [Herpetosiphonaceae bacterium]|nr:haloacid dehalogenase [Herpetosiphonaceae bacterium]